ncbi:factor-induced gene 2 protein isoform X2 [Quercus suber]
MDADFVKRNNDLQGRRLSLIDVSSEDDSLLFNSSFSESLHHSFSENEGHGSVELMESVDTNTLEDTFGTFEHMEQVPQPSESNEPEMTTKNRKYNLRKSLAWDSAFFTSAGVLEPEELSSIMEGVESVEKHKLPGIQEEIHRSAESISTLESLESESLTLASLEADLFEDVRASIQKSSAASNVANARSIAAPAVTGIQSIRSSKKVDFVSRNKIKAKSTSSKSNVGLQGPGKMTKPVFGGPHVSQSFAKRGEPTSLAKRPKVGKDSPSSTALTKRASMGGHHVKIVKDDARSAIGRGALVPKLPASGGLRNVVPRPTESSKSSSLGSSNATKTLPTSSSFDSSGSASSDNSSISTQNSMKRKIESGSGNPPSFGSTSKTPSRTPSINKVQSGSSHLSQLMSVPKLTPNTSPASSISEWSSESSSSCSTVKQISNNSRASLDTASCKGVSIDSDATHVLESQKHCNEQGSFGHESHMTGLLGQCVKRASIGSGALLHPASAKPSGLRLPSPKIGFFDGAKLAGRTPPGRIPSHPVVPSGLPKIGAGSVRPNGGPNEAKFGKPIRTLTAISNVKPDPQPTSLNMKPKSPTPLLESPFAAIQGSSASRNVKTCPGKSPKVQNRISPKTVGKSQLNAEKIESEGCDVGICDSETKGSAYRLDMKVTPINGGLNTSDSGTISYIVNINPGQKVGEDAIYDLHNPKYDLHSNNSTYEKEKLNFEDQVDGLSRQVGSIDINKEIQNNLIGDSLSRLHAGSKDDSDSLELSSQRELHDFSQQDENLK